MHYAQRRSPGSNAIGIGLVVALHLGVGYALIHALGTYDVSKMTEPLHATVITDLPKIIEPPPPPPPPIDHPRLDYRPDVVVRIKPPPSTQPTPAVTTTPPSSHDVAIATPIEPAPQPAVVTHAGAVRLAGPMLVYPARLQEMGMQGWVDVQCDVSEYGTTSNCSMVAHQGAMAFVDEALDYVRATRYSPATQNGVAVTEKDHRFHIVFKLSDR